MDVALGLLGGLALLAIGGELLVRGAVRIAERLGVSPLLIGLTLVGFGTSTPELVTSVGASLAGSPGIAVGNVVGSNIANALLVLGLAAIVAPVAVGPNTLARDGGIGALAAAALLAVALFWTLDRLVGALFLAGLAAYLVFAYRQETRAEGPHTAAFDKAEAFEGIHPEGLRTRNPRAGGGSPLVAALLALGGLAAVVLGGQLLVDAAIVLARTLSLDEAVIGLTVVAVGTSLPELVTSLVAAARRQPEVALGNVLGSSIYNVLGIGGATALIAPTAVPEAIARWDAPAMLLSSLLLLVVARTGWRVGRREGTALAAAYALYVWSIWPG